jgi:hypothetical protein
VREEITKLPAQVVCQQVIPVLTQALETASCPEERQALVRALGELGPTARPAVALLTERLRKATDPAELRVVLQTIDKIGTGPNEAVATLAALSTPARQAAMLGAKDRPPRAAYRGGRGHEGAKRLSPEEARLARQVLSRLTGVEAQVGVFDNAGLLCVRDIVNTTRALRQLVRQNHVAVRIETRGSGAGAVESVSNNLGPCALCVLLEEGGAVVVHATPALRAQGLDPEQLGKQLAGLCKKNETDRAVQTVVARARALKPAAKKAE